MSRAEWGEILQLSAHNLATEAPVSALETAPLSEKASRQFYPQETKYEISDFWGWT